MAPRSEGVLVETAEPGFWRDTLEKNPEVMSRLLADLWKVSQQAQGRDGRRPPTSVDEVFHLLVPEYSNLPFCEAVQEKLAGRSIRWLASQVHVTKSQVHRWITGERDIVVIADPRASMAHLEAVAKALRVHPAYFAEWRRLWILATLDEAFMAYPNLSIGVWKKFSGAPTNGR